MNDLLHETMRPRRQSALKRQIRQLLLSDITSGRMQVGDKLHSIHELSRLYDVSTTPIRDAIRELETVGYLERRHGSGTYIKMNRPQLSMDRTVMLCLEARAHLYGSLNTLLATHLLGNGLLPAVVDTQHEEGRTERLAQALASDARFFILHGEATLPFEQIARAASPGRHFIGAISWETNIHIQNLHLVLSDYQGGGELVADHLWGKGHRRVLLIGTDSMIQAITYPAILQHRHGPAFARKWLELGGTYTTLTSQWAPGDDACLDAQDVLASFHGANAPTAIFGLRDLELWHAQTILLQRAPDLAATLELVGYGNTPWSQAGHPPFPTVELDIETIASHIVRIIDTLLTDDSAQPAPAPVMPRLILR